MTEGIKERISALTDGELSEFEVRRVLEEINNSPELREYWKKLQLIRSGLSDQPLGFSNSDISKKVAKELGKSIEDLEEKKSTTIINPKLALAASFAVILSGSYFYSYTNISPASQDTFAIEASKKISEAINSPEAISLLDNAVKGMDAKLVNVDTGKQGQFYANYSTPSNGKTFKVSFSPINSNFNSSNIDASRVSYIHTPKGIFIVSVSGNISDEAKIKILSNVKLKNN
tara:strand:- start:413 stop:1105 length:693 start_codon:yes stop_codon:yes gene_type:complete